MKKLLSIITVLLLSSVLHAHCGSCGTEDSNHEKHSEIKSELTETQLTALKKLNRSYSDKYKKLNHKYKNDLSKIVGKNRVKEYKNEYCLKCEKMKKKACLRKKKNEKNSNCDSCKTK